MLIAERGQRGVESRKSFVQRGGCVEGFRDVKVGNNCSKGNLVDYAFER